MHKHHSSVDTTLAYSEMINDCSTFPNEDESDIVII